MKFFITDEDDKTYTVEEVEEKADDCDMKDDDEPSSESASLTSDEISALKSLAANADKLMALLSIEKDEHAGEEEAEALDSDEEIDEDEEIQKEEVIDTDEEAEKLVKKACDSKSSVGKIESKPTKANDSNEDNQTQIAQAWAKRYGG